ncbi:SDR family oxidoreductase [Pseudarthrobacter sp. CC12]|uniref:SDR family NAD(P)-dependent oxidoreductase n=1 Tax=Pseudarthrobacter sp. CC12 TaxID=3029193 RepID=UPI003264555A
MDLQLTGRTALIVGGSAGIGRAIATTLAREGARIVVASRSTRAMSTAEEIAFDLNVEVKGMLVDTTDDASVRKLITQITKTLGGVDILVNTAAAPWTPDKNVSALETSDDLLKGEFDTKVVGYLRTARAVAPGMVERGWGRIINVSGLGARNAWSVTQTVRNVGVAALTKNLADELGPSGINVTVVHPGITKTEGWKQRMMCEATQSGRTPEALEDAAAAKTSIRRVVDATEVADVVAFLASPRSVSITGDAIVVGGGTPGPVYY